MMQNKKAFSCILISLTIFFTSCGTSNSAKNINTVEVKEIKLCEYDKIDLSSDTYNSLTLKRVLDCLSTHSLKGDISANNKIAKIIKTKKHAALLTMSSKFIPANLRGEEIFQTIMDLDTSSLVLQNIISEEKLDFTLTYVSNKFLFSMIETIDNKDPYLYWIQLKNTITEPSDWLSYKEFKVDMKIFFAIRQKWEEGKIVLKPYEKD